MLEDLGDNTFAAEIDGRRYTFAHYDADKAWRTICELMATLGEGIHLNGLASEQEGDADHLLYAMGMKALLVGVGKDSGRSLALLKRLCCDNVTCDGKSIPQELFKTHYRGNLLHALEVAKCAMECQFGNFYAPLTKLVGLRKRQPISSPSPTQT